MIDCLIAAVAIGASVPVLHRDDDFTCWPVTTELDNNDPFWQLRANNPRTSQRCTPSISD